jgi:parallel beta-helix repeat protein
VEVTKRLLIKGLDRDTAIIEQGSKGVIAILVYASNSTIADLTVRDSYFGIWCLRTTGCEVSGNRVVNCTTGIRIDYSNNTLITNNEVLDNALRGIHIYGSSYNTVANNTIVNTRGIYASIDVEGYLGTGAEASKNTLFRNRLTNNSYGIWINVGASETKLYHNSFLNNTHDLNPAASTGASAHTVWNDNYPSGGNYWSRYTGLDLYSGPYQNITGSDGIGDTPYIPDTGSIDKYPLMQPPA